MLLPEVVQTNGVKVLSSQILASTVKLVLQIFKVPTFDRLKSKTVAIYLLFRLFSFSSRPYSICCGLSHHQTWHNCTASVLEATWHRLFNLPHSCQTIQMSLVSARRSTILNDTLHWLPKTLKSAKVWECGVGE